MKKDKEKYLMQVRAKTAYPTYRGIIGLMTKLGYLMAIFHGIGAIIAGITMMSKSGLAGFGTLLLGLIMATLVFLGARFFKEASLILVDMGDSIVDTNSKPALQEV